LRFRYREEGDGEALLCLDHAGRTSQLGTLLGQTRRVVTLELPDPLSLSPPELSAAIKEAIRALGLHRFALVARGGEAALALSLALDLPKEVAAVVLLGPTMIATNGQTAPAVDDAVLARLGTLATPSLIVFGTKDRSAPPEAGRHYRGRIPGCNLVFVYDAGPMMEEDRPEAVVELISDFLARGDHFLVRQHNDVLYP
jgi:pimeloyl-ACP methyl ester carboxylesterase